MGDAQPVTVRTLGQLAEVFGVTIKTVQRWKGRHGMPVEADGSYHVGKIAKWQTESSLTPELRKYRAPVAKAQMPLRGFALPEES